MEAFPLAIQRLSKSQLKRLAQEFKKSSENRKTKEDFADLLAATLTKAQQRLLLATVLLAGRTSLSVFHLPELKDLLAPADEFEEATATPQVVHYGDEGDVIEGQRLLLWAMLDGTVTYLDPGLELQSAAEASIYPSLYDSKARLLQVRANTIAARKIARQFAKMNEISSDTGVIQKGLKTREEMYAFGKLLNAKLIMCSGDRRKPKGFGRVSGRIHETLDDLMNTDDYKNHVAETDPHQEDSKFTCNDREMVLGVGFETSSLVFRMGAASAASKGPLGETLPMPSAIFWLELVQLRARY